MGFPLGYSELIIPKPLLQIVLFFNLLRRILVRFLDAVGLGDLLESDDVLPLEPPTDAPLTVRSVTAMLIQDMLPVVLFKDLLDGEEEEEPDRRAVADACAVCLYEFEPWEEVRRLSNCRHVFHRCCLDRWTEIDQRTCPLCRAPLVHEELQEAFHRRLWEATVADGDADFDDAQFWAPFALGSTGEWRKMKDRYTQISLEFSERSTQGLLKYKEIVKDDHNGSTDK
ncbi:hypothetical protein HPP92_028527 [Vanilla planifolia]|uniref:RING-type domain-containing protein n=1 Tax=Vanilla planifolia TaxID=51239 RepID=A0A835P7D1_VANPL|nr:hypothetical protein HPP92_028527 [Vanilla planifolia]